MSNQPEEKPPILGYVSGRREGSIPIDPPPPVLDYRKGAMRSKLAKIARKVLITLIVIAVICIIVMMFLGK